MSKRILALVLVLVLVLGSGTAFAADWDIVNKTTGDRNALEDVLFDDDLFFDVAFDQDNYKIEWAGMLYNLDEVQAKFDANPDLTMAEAVVGLTGTPAEPVSDHEMWYIQLDTTATDDTIIADGDDNTTIIIKIVDEDGVVQPVNGVTIELFASHGSLASTGEESRVTLQNGMGTIKLNSEMSATPLVAEITAKLYEAAQEYKDAIGQHEVIFNVFFQPEGADELVAPPVLVKAESNQADRVTLFFDKEVDIEDFEKDLRGLGDEFDDEGMFPVVIQDGDMYEILGYLPVEGNPKALVAVVGYNMEAWDMMIRLRDNTWTGVWSVTESDYGITTNYVEFLLTDARKPELQAIAMDGSMTMLTLEFSESISTIEDIVIDGGIVNVVDWDVNEFEYAWWDLDDNFYPAEDFRHFVDVYVEGWMTAGEHSITVFGAYDWAGDSDPKNISTTQTLEFTVDENDVMPSVEVTVESPEQFRLAFPEYVQVLSAVYGTDYMIQYNDGTTAVPNWVTVTDGIATPFINVNEAVLETDLDWTVIFGTDTNEVNYYNFPFRLVIAEDVLLNVENGLTNDEIIVGLNYPGSPLNMEDVVSPKVVAVEQTGDFNFDVIMDEPVKYFGTEDGIDTPSEEQGATIPVVVVEFIGKNSTGATVTVNGVVNGYGDDHSKDMVINVGEGLVSLQDLVDDDGYAEEWTLNVKNITDDIGNAAETVTYSFTVEKSVITPEEPTDFPFWVDYAYIGEYDGNDAVYVLFTDMVKTAGGAESAILLSNYSINNQDLPAGSYVRIDTSTAVLDDEDDVIGYLGVIIVLGTTDFEWAESNTLEVSKTLKSMDGDDLLGFVDYPEYSRYQEVIWWD
jgi:hypothetical protein